nr:hypothetical protein [Tanacetum cinerariifolium]
KQEVKNGIEKPIERRTRIIESLQNFRVIHKRSISLNNTSQISLVHAIAHILSTEEPEYSLSMGYEHLSTTPETKSDEVTESSAKNLLSILSECEVTLDNESESVQDNDSQRKEIDIVTNTNELLPPGFENDDSEGEIDVVEELHVDSLSQILKMSYPTMRHLILIICHFHDNLQNHLMVSLILSPMQEKRF